MPSTWDEVTNELAVRLARLRDTDAISLDVGRYFVQVKQFGSDLAVIASGTGPNLPEPARLHPDQVRQMAELGWDPPDPTHSLPDLPGPVSAEEARRVAVLMVTTVREVYKAETPADVLFSSHNDYQPTGPVLTTVKMNPEQQ